VLAAHRTQSARPQLRAMLRHLASLLRQRAASAAALVSASAGWPRWSMSCGRPTRAARRRARRAACCGVPLRVRAHGTGSPWRQGHIGPCRWA
jgi:hypothetical protein